MNKTDIQGGLPLGYLVQQSSAMEHRWKKRSPFFPIVRLLLESDGSNFLHKLDVNRRIIATGLTPLSLCLQFKNQLVADLFLNTNPQHWKERLDVNFGFV